MEYLVIPLLAFAPGIVWLVYFYMKDDLEPEPKKLIGKMFFAGMLGVVPAIIVEAPFKDGVLLTILVAPIVEELTKFGVVRYGIYRNTEFNEPMDGIIYAVTAALGFASVENVFYLFNSYSESQLVHDPAFGSFIGTFVVRAIFSVPSHAVNSAMWGYALGLAKFADTRHGNSLIRNGLLMAILFHGVFNLMATFGDLRWFIFVVPLMWLVLNRRIKEVIATSPFASQELKKTLMGFQKHSVPDEVKEYECSECGTSVKENETVCPKCGVSIEEIEKQGEEADQIPDLVGPVSEIDPSQIKEEAKEYVCSDCGSDVAADAKICPKCGSNLEDPSGEIPTQESLQPCCDNCGAPVSEGDKLCPACVKLLIS